MKQAFPEIRASATPTPSAFLCASGTKAGQPERVPAELFLVTSPSFQLQASASAGVKSFTMVAYTGEPMRLPNFPHPVIVDCAGLTPASQRLPILKDHDQKRIVGHSEKIEIHAGTGVVNVSGKVSGNGEDADQVRNLAGNGFPWQASIGAPVQAMDFVDEGETVTVHGRQYAGPLYVARKATLREISFVAMGADQNTSAQLAAAYQGATMNPFELWLKARGIDKSTINAAELTIWQKVHDAEVKAGLVLTPPKPDGANTTRCPNPEAIGANTVQSPTIQASVAEYTAELRKAQAAEIARVNAIRRHCVNHPELEVKAIAENWSENQTELEVLRVSRPTGGPYISTGAGQSEVNAAACFEAALCLSAGLKEDWLGKRFDQKVMNEAISADRYKGVTIGTLMHETIRAAGMYARIGAINDDTIRIAMRAERKLRGQPVIQAAGFSTLSLSGVLSNVANKAMLARYEAAAVVWPFFCAIRNHNDFKVHTRYRLTADGAMRKVGPDGELKNIAMSESSYTNQLDTWGGVITLTRQMQVNDDLGAFLELPLHFADLAALRPEEEFFVLLLANTGNFFHGNNANLITGGSYALTSAQAVAAITEAETKFSNQVNANQKPILAPPARVLCGTGNYVVARNVYNGQMKITGKDQTEVSANEHAGKYEPYKSAFVNNTSVKNSDGAAITGQSSTKWWLFADPARLAAFGMAFLNGNRNPTIENDDCEFTTLGMQWRCFLDFGVGQEDPKGAVQVNGA